VQKYIEKPLLLENRKFDIRCYAFIACCNPLLVLFHHGYIRLALNDYTSENYSSDDNSEAYKFIHLTNAAIQK
jgi:tubulin--tyrosine ligase like protein 10